MLIKGREGTVVREHTPQQFPRAVRGKARMPLSLRAWSLLSVIFMNNMVPCSWDVLKHPDLWAVLVKLHWHGFVYCTSCQDVPCWSDTGRQTLHTLLLSGQSLHDHTHTEFVACACHNLKCNYSRLFLNSAVGHPLLFMRTQIICCLVLFSILFCERFTR